MKKIFKGLFCLFVVVALYGFVKQNVCEITSDVMGCYSGVPENVPDTEKQSTQSLDEKGSYTNCADCHQNCQTEDQKAQLRDKEEWMRQQKQSLEEKESLTEDQKAQLRDKEAWMRRQRQSQQGEQPSDQ